MISEEDAWNQLVKFIQDNTCWESYGYYGPLVYTGPLLIEIAHIATERGILLKIPEVEDDH